MIGSATATVCPWAFVRSTARLAGLAARVVEERGTLQSLPSRRALLHDELHPVRATPPSRRPRRGGDSTRRSKHRLAPPPQPDSPSFLHKHGWELGRDLVIGLLLVVAGFQLDDMIADRQERLESGRAEQAERLENGRAEQEEVLENVRFIRDRASDPNAFKPSFAGMNFRNAELSGLYLGCPESEYRRPDPDRIEHRCVNFQAANLSGARLTGANLAGAFMFGADLSHADLRFMDLTGVDLSNANLVGADLTGSRLFDAIVSEANFTGATLKHTALMGAVLDNADFGDTDLRDTQISGSCFATAKWPLDYNAPTPVCPVRPPEGLPVPPDV